MSVTDFNSHCWFKSDTRLGCVHVGVKANEAERANLDGPHRVFQQAALLSNLELFVQSLELWQKIDLDLMPSDAPDRFGITLNLSLKAPDDVPAQSPEKHPELAVVFKDDVLSQLAPLNETLSRVISLAGSTVKLQVELDRFEVADDEYASCKSNGLETGSAVLLPGSFKPDWFVTARCIESEVDYMVRGRLNARSGEIELSLEPGKETVDIANTNSARETDSGGDTVSKGELRVIGRNVLEAPIDRLLTTDVTLPVNLDQLSLIVDGELHAHGSIIEYGRGSLFTVDEVVTG